MAQPAKIFDSYDAIGNREDLADVIYDISPTETPGLMAFGRGRASGTTHEWQTDALEAAALNAVLEGDDPTPIVITPTQRVLNNTQISQKTILISGTQEAVDKAGRKSELSYQLARRAKEIKRDVEFGITQNTARKAGSSGSETRQSAGVETWMLTVANHDRGTGGAATASTAGTPDDAAQPGDATAPNLRAFSEAQLKNVLRNVWNAGGEPNMILVGPFNKQKASEFTGSSTRFDVGEDKRLVAAIDVYVSDYGEHTIVPSRFSRDRSALVLTTSLWSVDYLRAFRQHALSKTGDSERRQIVTECTLRASNEAGNGIVADLLTA